MNYLRRNRIGAQFAWRIIEMLESPAYRVLSLAAHRVLARIEIELAQHGGNDNGRLPVTFNQFVEYGINRHAIAPAIRELCALGFLEVTEQGRAGNAEFRQPNKFRLSYRPVGRAKPTDEWRQIKTHEQAVARQAEARRPQRRSRLPRPRLVDGGNITVYHKTNKSALGPVGDSLEDYR